MMTLKQLKRRVDKLIKEGHGDKVVARNDIEYGLTKVSNIEVEMNTVYSSMDTNLPVDKEVVAIA